MKVFIAKNLLRLAGHLSLGANQRLGGLLGSLAWKLDKKSQHVSLTNLQLCFPEKDEAWHRAIGRESLAAMAQAMLESPRLWKLSLSELDKRLLNPESMEPILESYKKGEGVIVASPHLGSWEFVGLITGRHMKMTSLFRPPRMEELSDLILEGRENSGATLVPTDSSGVKALTRALRNGEATGILPDQEPPQGAGVFADFFGHTAYTMPLILKLAKKRRIPIYFVYAERRKGGFHLHVEQGKESLYEGSAEEACTVMNGQIENLIRNCPQQYNWNYKRFRHHPEQQNRYKKN